MRVLPVVAGLAALVTLIPGGSGLAKQAHPAKQVHAAAKQKASHGASHAAHASRKASHRTAQASKHCSVSASGPHSFSGIASIYEAERTSGEGPAQVLTAAHCTLPFGTRLQVTNVASGRTVIVTIMDRGPFVRGRVLDLSPAAARTIGLTTGIVRIKAEVMSAPTGDEVAE
jgi:rare lipoprotein A